MMRCPEPTCRVPLHPSEVQTALGPQLFSKYERIVLHRSLAGMGDIAWCPRSWCGQPSVVEEEDAPMAICASCSFCFCIQCGRTWSIEHACDDGLPGLPSLPDPPQEDAGMISTETQAHIEGQRRRAEATRAGAASALFLASKLNCEMKRCPKCKQAIEKVSGCNHMVCATC